MKNNLLARFAIIIGSIALCVLILRVYPVRLGIDLAGGTSLLYELDLSQVSEGVRENPSETAERVITRLKERVDPNSQKNLIWRVVGGRRIQVQMPLASNEVREARKRLEEANTALRNASLRQSQIQNAISKTGAERESAIAALVPAGDDRVKLIKDLAVANDELRAVEAEVKKFSDPTNLPAALIERKLKAQTAYDAAQLAVIRSNVDTSKLSALLEAMANPKNTAARDDLKTFVDRYPAQKKLIEEVVVAQQALEKLGGGFDDPAELQRLLRGSGVLDFRITVSPSELNNSQLEAAMQSLQTFGPRQVVEQNKRWFEIAPNGRDNFGFGGYIIGSWAGKPYVLLYDDPARALTHDGTRQNWRLTQAAREYDPQNAQTLVTFRFDAVGASYFGELTRNNVSRHMAILLDDQALTAPTIQTPITGGRGQITLGKAGEAGGRTVKQINDEAEAIAKILNAGALDAALQPEPISVVQISPEMGKDNIDRGMWSCIYAVAAVCVFMLVYYTITGVFANIAVLINGLLVVAVMAYMQGTFTLPGIAGLVLTLGMAVDANVLINERIREELHKGASLFMAVKQGYDKVFWTIFDANLTTSLTSIVLIFFGSEEVKGFGITLLIGLIVHMFTALFVTRTLMLASIKWGIIRQIDDGSVGEYLREIFSFTWLRQGKWPFMRVITVSNIDWIGKRYYFWTASLLITVAGLVVFLARGEDKYDIEFRGGTQVTFALRQDAQLSLDDVRNKIAAIARTPGLNEQERTALKDLEGARVYQVGKPEENKFEMQTTVADAPGLLIKNKMLDLLAAQFGDVLDVKPTVTFKNAGADRRNIDPLLQNGTLVPVVKSTLDQIFEARGVSGLPARDVTDYVNGVATLLEDINPPQTKAQLESRIRTARLSPEMKTLYRNFTVLPITAVVRATTGPAAGSAALATEPAAEDDKRPLTKAVVLSSDPAITYENNIGVWTDKIAGSEWTIVTTAMESASKFENVTSFDAVVAERAKTSAVLAIFLSLIAIVIYVWVRFGGLRYGVGAILSLLHDASVAVAATVLSGWMYEAVFGGKQNFLLLADFKINLTMVAAYLTIIGYSVNDTIVIFDRVRELRGRSTGPLTKQIVNDAINQCFGRTIWTTFTVLITVIILYIWGGEGIRGFAFAMIVGTITGVYSTLAIASPMLLSVKEKVTDRPKSDVFKRMDEAPVTP